MELLLESPCIQVTCFSYRTPISSPWNGFGNRYTLQCHSILKFQGCVITMALIAYFSFHKFIVHVSRENGVDSPFSQFYSLMMIWKILERSQWYSKELFKSELRYLYFSLNLLRSSFTIPANFRSRSSEDVLFAPRTHWTVGHRSVTVVLKVLKGKCLPFPDF